MPDLQQTFDELKDSLNTATNDLATRIQTLIDNTDLTDQELRDGLQPIVDSLNALAQ